MATAQAYRYEIEGRLRDLDLKTHVSVRYEPGPSVVRIGVCVDGYDWDRRAAVIDRLLAFEYDHADELAVEFDVFPLEAVNDAEYAEI